VYGNFAGSFTSFSVDAVAAAKFQHQINTYTLYFVYLGIGSFTTSYISILGFSYTGERITRAIRELYLRAIFRQNIAFFDFLGSGEITTRISSDMNLVQDGIGQKIGLFVTGVSMFVFYTIVEAFPYHVGGNSSTHHDDGCQWHLDEKSPDTLHRRIRHSCLPC
jgi:ATP-binding cassette subfamily B (MDR/TAP) protein 1